MAATVMTIPVTPNETPTFTKPAMAKAIPTRMKKIAPMRYQMRLLLETAMMGMAVSLLLTP